jgi:hypothetical protein
MFQDIHFQTTGVFSSGAATTSYMVVPYNCVLRDAKAIVDGDPGDGETISLLNDSKTIGKVTFGSGITAGAMGTYAPDETNGELTLMANSSLSIVTSDAAAANFHLDVELDPECIVPEP